MMSPSRATNRKSVEQTAGIKGRQHTVRHRDAHSSKSPPTGQRAPHSAPSPRTGRCGAPEQC